jgi:hypothetical protein
MRRTPDGKGCAVTCGHRRIVEEYRDARFAWEALRESGLDVGGSVAGTAGSNAGAYQLSDEEFAEAYPPPTFPQWLKGRAGANQDPDDA